MNSVRKARILFFLENCNISGLRYLGQRCEIWGRILWLVVLIVSMIGMIKIFILTYERFFTDIVSIGINTDYLNWKNTFFAISVCLRRGININRFTPKLTVENDINYKKSIYDIVFFNSEDSNRVLAGPCKGRNETCDVDVDAIRKQFIPQNCTDFMIDVQFNDKKFNKCDDIFKYHSTLMGPCFIANAIIDYDTDPNKLPLKFDREFVHPIFSFQTKKDVYYEYKLYVHSPEDFPSNKGFEYDIKDSRKYRFSIIEMENDPSVKNSSTIEERRCRFPDEKISPNDLFYYSFTTCLQKMQIEVELETCNCTLHLSPDIYKDKYCLFSKYGCIMTANDKFNNIFFDKFCVKSCIQIELELVSAEEVIEESNLSNYFKQEIVITNTPTMRYTRSVARNNLDLVVSIGGVAGLFFGASIMNIFEIIYLFFIRKF